MLTGEGGSQVAKPSDFSLRIVSRTLQTIHVKPMGLNRLKFIVQGVAAYHAIFKIKGVKAIDVQNGMQLCRDT